MTESDTPKENWIDQTMKFSLKELYNCGGIEGLNDLAERRANLGEAQFLGDLSYRVVGVENEEILVQVTAEVITAD
jgi:hypothetical protein